MTIDFAGSWSYRSLVNDPDLSTPFGELQFGAGALVLHEPQPGVIGGEEWVYDYLGYLVPDWPDGVGQVATITGSIIRTVPHSSGQAPAGYTATFYAVRA